MEKRNLGNSGLQVAPLALGGNVFGWTVSEENAFPILDAFVSAGFNLIDTADIYPRWVPGNQGGESEEIIGNWLKRSGKRNEVIVATKVGMDMGAGKKGLAKDYVLRSADDSLRRLQTDYIDLYQSHQDDPETPLEETLEAYAQLIKEGKVRAIGASNYSAARLAEALNVSKRLGLPRYESLQPLYNLYDRAVYEDELEPLCVREGLGVINFYSLAAGFLSGKYRSEDDLSKSARRHGQEVPERTWLPYTRRAGPGGLTISFDSGARCARVVDSTPEHHGTDRKRDESGPTERSYRSNEARVGPRSDRVA